MERLTLFFQPAQVCIFVSVDLISQCESDCFGTENPSRVKTTCCNIFRGFQSFAKCANEIYDMAINIPANPHALCVSLMPAKWRHRSHASSTISHAWLTNPDELFFNTCLITNIQLNIPEDNTKRRLTLLQDTKIQSLKRSLEHLPTFSGAFGSLRKIVGTSSDIFGKVRKSLENRRES